MDEKKPGKKSTTIYQSYLLRLWRSANSYSWLATLETPGTHEHHNFSDLASFFAFVQARTAIPPDHPPPIPQNIEQVDSGFD